jgi:hypothetical protein
VEDANSVAAAAMAATAAMAVTAAMEDSLVGSEQAIEAMEAMEAMEATATDSRAPAVALAVTREVGRSSARASRAVVDTNNRVGAATSSRVAAVAVVAASVVAAAVVAVEAHVSVL